jgi:hypothetical protein
MKIASAVLVTLLLTFFGWAQTPKSVGTQPGKPASAPAAMGESPCVFDFERGEVPGCVRASAAGELFITPQYLSELSFDSHGLAAVLSHEQEWMYVNRKGKVLITGVPTMDNWADAFHDGLVRVVRNKKYGYADRRGQVVIAPVYDGAMNFDKGRAAVCKGCERKCAEPGCEHHLFAGGEWVSINTKGDVVK